MNRFTAIVEQVALPFGWRVIIEVTPEADYFLRVLAEDGTDNVTGTPTTWKGRKWPLSFHMTDGEVVQTAFLATMTAVEHEVREMFSFQGQTIFDPHYDIYKLVALRSQPNALKERTAA